MSIYRLHIDSAAALQQSGQAPAASNVVPRDASLDGEPPEAMASDQVQLSAKSGTAYEELQRKNEQQNGIALAIHKSDQAVQALGQKIDALKAPLEQIVKNYPPFSPQDKARMKLLMSYSSIRQEIARLTFPPPPAELNALNNVALPPALPKGADDSQIADHLSKLDAASAAVSDFRQQLATGTASLVAAAPSLPSISGDKTAETAQSAALLSQSAALQLSVEVGRQFAISLAQGVSADEHSQFLKGLS